VSTRPFGPNERAGRPDWPAAWLHRPQPRRGQRADARHDRAPRARQTRGRSDGMGPVELTCQVGVRPRTSTAAKPAGDTPRALARPPLQLAGEARARTVGQDRQASVGTARAGSCHDQSPARRPRQRGRPSRPVSGGRAVGARRMPRCRRHSPARRPTRPHAPLEMLALRHSAPSRSSLWPLSSPVPSSWVRVAQ
jgi:hypothetical protein